MKSIEIVARTIMGVTLAVCLTAIVISSMNNNTERKHIEAEARKVCADYVYYEDAHGCHEAEGVEYYTPSK